MQAVDNRESRLRKAFTRIEIDGKIRREDLVKLLTVSRTLRKKSFNHPFYTLDTRIHASYTKGGRGSDIQGDSGQGWPLCKGVLYKYTDSLKNDSKPYTFEFYLYILHILHLLRAAFRGVVIDTIEHNLLKGRESVVETWQS